jgi:HK97 family phage prohead protease
MAESQQLLLTQHNQIQLTMDKIRKPVNYKSLAIDDSGVLIEQSNRKISGYAAVFGNKDDSGDILIKGCFAKSITERGPESKTNRKIAFLWMHDMDEPLGRITKLIEDEKGLYFEAELDMIPEADRALVQMESGTLNQFSIGFQYVWDKMEYNEELDAFIVKEVNLFECSVVTIGANEDTEYSGLKSDQIESEENKLFRDTEKALKQLPIEQAYEFRQLIAKHISLTNSKPIESLKEEVKPKATDYTSIINSFKI